jgi:DNA-binding transcriptional LysR family regulator
VLARTPFLRDFAERGELLAPFALRMPSRYRYFLVENPATEATPHARAFRDWLIGQTQRPNAAG